MEVGPVYALTDTVCQRADSTPGQIGMPGADLAFSQKSDGLGHWLPVSWLQDSFRYPWGAASPVLQGACSCLIRAPELLSPKREPS
jgi:hypothetical protein